MAFFMVISPRACFAVERFGVIDVVPTFYSLETYQNSEPSLGRGTGTNYSKFVIHAFNDTAINWLYATESQNSFALPWNVTDEMLDVDATLDWSPGGNDYIADINPNSFEMEVWKATDPVTGTLFGQSIYVPGASPLYLSPDTEGVDQPWLRTVTVNGVDHLFVGYNGFDDFVFNPNTARVVWSTNGGTSWNKTILETANPAVGQDSPSIRLSISPDGTQVYALFQRWNAKSGGDFIGDVVVKRDDNFGSSGFGALGTGTLVAHNITLPLGTSLGAERLGGGCDVVCDPTHPFKVYVAYTEVSGGVPILRIQASADSGGSFGLVYSIPNASLPSLAVSGDGTVGILCLEQNGNYLEVHFLKAFGGSFAPLSIIERVLAKFPNNNPVKTFDPYVGDYFQLKAVNFNFFGTFSASGDPDPSHFPSAVYFQRYVSVSGIVQSNAPLTSPGNLVNLYNDTNSGMVAVTNISSSIDPFFFYDTGAPLAFRWPILLWRPYFFYDPSDPLSGISHMVFPEAGPTEPPYQLFTSPALGAGAAWSFAANSPVTQFDGASEAPLSGSQPQAFFRLQQNVASGQFQLLSAAGPNGSVDPRGTLSVPGGSTQVFTAVPMGNYAVSQWYLDGAPVQSGGATLTVSNIVSEHTVVVTFAAFNDLAVTLADLPIIPGPTLPGGTNVYEINVENEGLNPLTGVVLTNPLPATVAFQSVTSSQGSVNFSGGVVSGSLGSLAPGASAAVDITFVPVVSGAITDTVQVACAQSEPNLANNFATDVTVVMDPVTITNEPAPQTVPAGGTATFSVGVSGTPPFFYQWIYNDTNIINNATNSSLVLTNVSATQAGFYSAHITQTLGGPEGLLETNSTDAQLAIGSPGSPIGRTMQPRVFYPKRKIR